MRAESEAGHPQLALHRGSVVKTGWRGALQRDCRLTLGRRLGLAAATLAIAGVLLGAYLGQHGGWALAAGIAGLAAVGSAASQLLRRAILGPLERAISFANLMAAGDLSSRMAGQASGELSDLARALNQLNVNLQAVVSDVRHEVEGVQVASNEISSGNHDLSARTEAQASSLEEAAASMEQLTSIVAQSANSAREAGVLADRAAVVAGEGNVAMGEVVSTMDQISRSSSRIAEIILFPAFESGKSSAKLDWAPLSTDLQGSPNG